MCVCREGSIRIPKIGLLLSLFPGIIERSSSTKNRSAEVAKSPSSFLILSDLSLKSMIITRLLSFNVTLVNGSQTASFAFWVRVREAGGEGERSWNGDGKTNKQFLKIFSFTVNICF